LKKEVAVFKPEKALIKCNPIYLCFETDSQDLEKSLKANITNFKKPCQAITGFNIHPEFTPDCHKKSLHIEFFMYSPYDQQHVEAYGWLISKEFSTEIKDKDPGDGPCVEFKKYYFCIKAIKCKYNIIKCIKIFILKVQRG